MMALDPDMLAAKLKLAALGLLGAILSIASDPPATRIERASAILIGIVIAMLATPPTVATWKSLAEWELAIAAAYGIGGKGLVGWIIRAARDPPAAARELLGLRGKGEGGK